MQVVRKVPPTTIVRTSEEYSTRSGHVSRNVTNGTYDLHWLEKSAMKRWIVAIALVALVLPSSVWARGNKTMAGNGQVVHSRRAGVIMHRAVPPFRGVHVYEGRQAKQAGMVHSSAGRQMGW